MKMWVFLVPTAILGVIVFGAKVLQGKKKK
jgi:hypothetical protein